MCIREPAVPLRGQAPEAFRATDFTRLVVKGDPPPAEVMSLQFTWDGYDSALAAPLVLDLARLAAGALAAGESGALGALGFFFKDPLGTNEHRLAEQAAALSNWASTPRG